MTQITQPPSDSIVNRVIQPQLVTQPHPTHRASRLRAWLRRYLPAELVCTSSALLAAWLTLMMTNNPGWAALAGAWGENLGFYCLMFGREIWRQPQWRAVPTIIAGLVLEFGPAELIDNILRPSLMYLGLLLAPTPMLGIVIGKLVADIGFYIPTIVSYELLRRFSKRTTYE